MIVLERNDNNRVQSVKVVELGVSVSPSSLSYLDDGIVYVGSLFGDSEVCHCVCLFGVCVVCVCVWCC